MGNGTFPRNMLADQSPRSKRYGYDNLNRLTVMDRGILNTAGREVDTPADSACLHSNQQ